MEFPMFPYESLTLELELGLRSSDVLMHELAAAAHVHGMPVAFPFYDRGIVELAAGTTVEPQGPSMTTRRRIILRKIRRIGLVLSPNIFLRYAFRDFNTP